MHDKEECVINIRNIKQVLNHGLVLKKAWLKPYIDMNAELRKNAKNDLKKYFFMLKNNAVFEKKPWKIRENTDIKLAATEARRNDLVSEPEYHTTKLFSENLLAIEMKKIKLRMNKPVCLGRPMLQVSKIVMYEFLYGYVKPKYG